MHLRILGTSLPGIRFCDPAGQPLTPVYLGIQRRDEVVFRTPGDAPSAVFDLEVDAVPVEGGWDFRGPFVHGKRGDRFLYLSWGVLSGEAFAMFRRAKIMLGAVPSDTLAAAVATGGLEGALGLTDRRGSPLCAAVRPPVIAWSAG